MGQSPNGTRHSTTLEFVAIVVLVAGVVVAVGASQLRVSSPSRPDLARSGDALASPSREPESPTKVAAPRVVAAARARPQATPTAQAKDTASEATEVVPWLNPLPPLLSLMVSAESPDVRAHAEKLNRWLKLTVDMGVRQCWTQRSAKRAWAVFSAGLDRSDDGSSLKVTHLSLIKVHGDYAPGREEEACVTDVLGAITGRKGSEGELEALAPYFPMTHKFGVELP